jgi:hypothetical protein
LLATAFEGARQAFLTVIVTSNGVRERQWYDRNQDDVMKLVNETLGELEPSPWISAFKAIRNGPGTRGSLRPAEWPPQALHLTVGSSRSTFS